MRLLRICVGMLSHRHALKSTRPSGPASSVRLGRIDVDAVHLRGAGRVEGVHRWRREARLVVRRLRQGLDELGPTVVREEVVDHLLVAVWIGRSVN